MKGISAFQLKVLTWLMVLRLFKRVTKLLATSRLINVIFIEFNLNSRLLFQKYFQTPRNIQALHLHTKEKKQLINCH